MKPVTKQAFELFHQGNLALMRMERNGILIDVGYLDRQLEETANKIRRLEDKLMNHQVFSVWKRRFGNSAKLDSRYQLEKVVFEELGHRRTGRTTDTGRNKADESAFEFVSEPFVKQYFQLQKLKKARNTYLLQIQRELDNRHRIHPFFNLHTSSSYRSSADRPNIQNFPVRDPLQGEIIRRCIVAPRGYQIGEIDISGNEVRWSAIYNEDPQLISYILDPTTDMHRDMAKECFLLDTDPADPYWKDKTAGSGSFVRYVAKNRFVFPQFYGSFWHSIARSLWESLQLYQLKTDQGVSIEQHLKERGIRKLGKAKENEEPKRGTFQWHIKEVEKRFWKERFNVYHQWKWDWWEKFCQQGYFLYKTGFVGSGLLDRKQVCNYPIQGSAFHGLLWAICRLQEWLDRYKMKSKMIAEIHDSILLELWTPEISDVLHKAKELITVEMCKEWKYIKIPFDVEAEVAPEGGSWFDKQRYELS